MQLGAGFDRETGATRNAGPPNVALFRASWAPSEGVWDILKLSLEVLVLAGILTRILNGQFEKCWLGSTETWPPPDFSCAATLGASTPLGLHPKMEEVPYETIHFGRILGTLLRGAGGLVSRY